MPLEEARLAARRASGGVEQAKELHRDARSFVWLEDARRDVKYAMRTLVRNPGFTAVAVLTIALGISANTAIFSVIDTLLLRRPRFEHLERLVYLLDTNPRVPADVEVPPSPGNVLDWREEAQSFDRMAIWRIWYYTLIGSEGHAAFSESIRGVRVSSSFFSTLGVNAALGRTFRQEEENPGRDDVVILSNGLWNRRFAADPDIIGQQVLIDGRPMLVIGVLPSDFQFYLSDFEVWMPLTIADAFQDRHTHSVMVVARLAPGVPVAQAQAEMDTIAGRLEQVHPDTNAGWGVKVVPLYPSCEVRDVRPALLVLLGAAGFVLLIACANVANLLLARAVARQREITIRAAIGATRPRLIRQMLTESVLLASLGAVIGVMVAYWGVRMLIPSSHTPVLTKPSATS